MWGGRRDQGHRGTSAKAVSRAAWGEGGGGGDVLGAGANAKGAEGWGVLDDLDDDDAAVSPNSHPRVPSTSAPRSSSGAALPPNAPSSTGKKSQKSDP
jgi:hypothetical protein